MGSILQDNNLENQQPARYSGVKSRGIQQLERDDPQFALRAASFVLNKYDNLLYRKLARPLYEEVSDGVLFCIVTMTHGALKVLFTFEGQRMFFCYNDGRSSFQCCQGLERGSLCLSMED